MGLNFFKGLTTLVDDDVVHNPVLQFSENDVVHNPDLQFDVVHNPDLQFSIAFTKKKMNKL